MKITLTFLLTTLLFSCGRFAESSIITDPQPDGGVELKEIPKMLLGTYNSLTDSLDTAHLMVTDKGIIMRIVRNPNLSIAEIDSSERRHLKDTVYREGNDSMTVRVTMDSIFQHNVHFDTLYYSSDKYVIRKSKGFYFCNQKFRHKWLVRALRISENGILISKLRSKEEISRLDDYSLNEPDSIVYKTPGTEKLRTYLTDEKFKNEWMFVRIEYGLQHKL
jgi:hypothetical protein